MQVLKMKEDSALIKQDLILVDQLRVKKGGQIVEFEAIVTEMKKKFKFAICQLPTD